MEKHSIACAVPALLRPTWAEISLKNLAFNYRQVKRLTGKSVKVLAAVKANAYGHGIVETARVLEQNNVDFFGVACAEEARILVNAGIKTPLLILGVLAAAELKLALALGARITIADERSARLARRFAAPDRPVRAHIKIDTGMGRVGFWHEQAEAVIKKIARQKNMVIEGIFTHFPSADTDRRFTERQIKIFARLVGRLRRQNIEIPLAHAANSIGLSAFKNSHLNLVRPGIMLYGISPGAGMPENVTLKPVLAFKSRIIYLKTAAKGRSISYGRTYRAKKSTVIATIPAGYADGYARALSNKARVLVRGRFCPVAGRVCMDQTMIDVGHVPGVGIGDTVVLIGTQQGKTVYAEEIARLCRTIPYEITCGISPRVNRIFDD